MWDVVSGAQSVVALASETSAAPPTVTLGGEALHLLAAPALFWPAGGTVFIADLHIGKAATFRARGLPVPSGTTMVNLARIDSLLNATAATRLVVLGDFLHAADSHSPSVLQALADWRASWPLLQIILVRGNHDSHAGDPPAPLRFEVVDEPWLIGPFACCHHPQQHATHHVLAGHVHPAVRLRGRAGDGLRLPCFVNEPGLTLLPAFGEFTGSHVLRPGPSRALFAVGAGRVWRLPSRGENR
jgi:DNA ligase-associated metallophosphoesterase